MSNLDPCDDPIPETPNPRLWYLFGEDPARFIGRDVGSDEGVDITLARIRGLDDSELLDEYLRIEASVFKRRRVVAALNRRKLELDTIGDRAEQLKHRRERRHVPEQNDEPEPEPTYRHVKCESDDVEQESNIAFYCNTCDMRAPKNRVEVVEP